MLKGAALVNTLIENANRVQAYDFSHLDNRQDQAAGANGPRKLSGSKMTTKVKVTSENRVSYTFAL